MNIDEMKAGRELDVLVTEKIFGCRVRYVTPGDALVPEYNEWYMVEDRPEGIKYSKMPLFSTDITAAWKVVEWLAIGGIISISNGDGDSHDCDFIPFGFPHDSGICLSSAHVSAETWPLAISRAALKAVTTNG